MTDSFQIFLNPSIILKFEAIQSWVVRAPLNNLQRKQKQGVLGDYNFLRHPNIGLRVIL
jgi:hypothetical protein